MSQTGVGTQSGRSSTSSTGAGGAGTAPTAAATPKYLGVIYLGLNPDAPHEGKLLYEMNRDRGLARRIVDSSEPDVFIDGEKRYDLRTEEGIAGFLEAQGAEPALRERLARLLGEQWEDGRDEVAQLIQVYVQAERGERRMERVVFSGHSNGEMIWGDDNGVIGLELLEVLAELFPGAASQVRDLMFSACYTGGERAILRYRKMFPKIESIWAYSASSPGVWTGAQDHLRIWEKATELSPPAQLEKALAAGTRKGENVAVWTLQGGYQGENPLRLEDAEAALEADEALFQQYLQGDQEVGDPQSCPLRNYYRLIQQTLSLAELSADRMEELKERRDVTLRLLFYGLVREKFAAAYREPIEAGYAEARLPMPAYATLPPARIQGRRCDCSRRGCGTWIRRSFRSPGCEQCPIAGVLSGVIM